ncbi:hypothetical protein APF79_12000 [bacterium BRH_c32]|nr:MAG: hypothetical protein APF79_12000 [bacterium BRH_c32]
MVSKSENLEEKFKHLYEIISNDVFLNKQAIGGEAPFFITAFHPANQQKIDKYISSLIKKLELGGISVLEINLFDLSIGLMENRSTGEQNILDKILSKENFLSKQSLLKQLQSVLDSETKIIPEIERRIKENDHKVAFLTGIGLVYPFIRSHNILNNLHKVFKVIPVVTFFPGEYDGTFLNLFGQLKDDNYYRAFNIDIIKLKNEQ